jgi:hypothetical protein
MQVPPYRVMRFAPEIFSQKFLSNYQILDFKVYIIVLKLDKNVVVNLIHLIGLNWPISVFAR